VVVVVWMKTYERMRVESRSVRRGPVVSEFFLSFVGLFSNEGVSGFR
jgi:hypothetical protein